MSAVGAETPTLLALEPAELERRFVELGGRPYDARVARAQVLGRGILDYARMTALPAGLRERLAAELPVLSGREVGRTVAGDGTTKLLIEFPRRREHEHEKDALVETVHMPSLYAGEDDPAGATLCVSTQVGCPVACPFCASGKLGLVRNLAAHEILEQYALGRSLSPLSRSVVMGIGEPLLNFESLALALAAVHDEIGLGARRITVSTVGFPDRLRRIARSKPRFQLAISLHSADDAQRAELVPAMRGTSVAEVVAAGDDWFAATGREVTYEVVLLGGVNDSADHARRMAQLLAGHRCTVNLIPFNPVADSPYRRPGREEIDRFQTTLARAGVVATVRWSRGVEADAACGQLRVRALR